MEFSLKPASTFSFEELVTLLNNSFSGYFVPIQFTEATLITMLRRDSVDLSASQVLLADEHPAGIALIARRGWTSRLGGMAIIPELRGKRAGSWMMEQLLREASERGEREMLLEVIEQNVAAIRLYKSSGFETIRRLVGYVGKELQTNKENETQGGFLAAGDGDESHLKTGSTIEEIDLRKLGQLVSRYAPSDLPWQICGETLALMTPPVRAYRDGDAFAAISDPAQEHVVIWSLLVLPESRGQGLSLEILRTLAGIFTGKIWHVPALCPEGAGRAFVRAGFEQERLSQFQMRLPLG